MMHHIRVLGCIQMLLLGTIYCCTMSVDSDSSGLTFEFDLSSMERPYGSTWTDRYTGTTFEATVCNSARLMAPKCSIQNAVAMESNTCKAYGRYDSLMLTEFLDDAHPENGIVLTYGNGGNCQSSISGKSSATFMIACESSMRNPDNMLTKVESSPDGCQHIFYFQSQAGCGKGKKQVVAGGGDSSSSGGMIFLYCLLGVAAYFLLGALYNNRVDGAEGVDSVPHIDYLRKVYSVTLDVASSFMDSMSVGSTASASARRMGSEFSYSAVRATNPEAIARSAKDLGAAAGETVSMGVHSAAQSVSNAAEKYVPHIKAAGGQISKAVAASADKYIPPAIGKHFKKSTASVNHAARYDANVAAKQTQNKSQGESESEASNPILNVNDDEEEEEETVSFGAQV